MWNRGSLRRAGLVSIATLLVLGGCASTEATRQSPDAALAASTKVEFDRTNKAYFNCVFSITEGYAKNPAFLPDDISTAAIADCYPQMREHYEAYRRYAIAAHPEWPERTIRSSEDQYQRGNEAMARKNIIALVLRLRSGS